jgi:hypothetical protein
MNENEQNTENWQIKINNFSFSLLSVSPVGFFFRVIQKASMVFGSKGRLLKLMFACSVEKQQQSATSNHKDWLWIIFSATYGRLFEIIHKFDRCDGKNESIFGS